MTIIDLMGIFEWHWFILVAMMMIVIMMVMGRRRRRIARMKIATSGLGSSVGANWRPVLSGGQMLATDEKMVKEQITMIAMMAAMMVIMLSRWSTLGRWRVGECWRQTCPHRCFSHSSTSACPRWKYNLSIIASVVDISLCRGSFRIICRYM